MSYGIRVWGPTGALELDENSFTVRVVYSAIVQPGGGVRSNFISIPGVAPSTHSAVCIPLSTYDTGGQNHNSIQFTPVISSGGVTLYYGCPSTSTGPVGTSAQRIIVMKDK